MWDWERALAAAGRWPWMWPDPNRASSLLLAPPLPLPEMVMIGSGAGIARGPRRPAVAPTPVCVVVDSRVCECVLVADRRLRFDLTVVLRERSELVLLLPFFVDISSSENRDLAIFSPMGGPGVADTASGCTGGFALVRGLCMVGEVVTAGMV